jgi:hypothetical protein
MLLTSIVLAIHLNCIYCNLQTGQCDNEGKDVKITNETFEFHKFGKAKTLTYSSKFFDHTCKKGGQEFKFKAHVYLLDEPEKNLKTISATVTPGVGGGDGPYGRNYQSGWSKISPLVIYGQKLSAKSNEIWAPLIRIAPVGYDFSGETSKKSL